MEGSNGWIETKLGGVGWTQEQALFRFCTSSRRTMRLQASAPNDAATPAPAQLSIALLHSTASCHNIAGLLPWL